MGGRGLDTWAWEGARWIQAPPSWPFRDHSFLCREVPRAKGTRLLSDGLPGVSGLSVTRDAASPCLLASLHCQTTSTFKTKCCHLNRVLWTQHRLAGAPGSKANFSPLQPTQRRSRKRLSCFGKNQVTPKIHSFI